MLCWKKNQRPASLEKFCSRPIWKVAAMKLHFEMIFIEEATSGKVWYLQQGGRDGHSTLVEFSLAMEPYWVQISVFLFILTIYDYLIKKWEN